MYTYYGMGSIPDLVFGGTERLVGAGEDKRDGVFYTGVINGHLAVESPLSVSVLDYDLEGSSPYITVKVEIFETLASNANTYLRTGVCESPAFDGATEYHNVLRDMPNDIPLTIQNVGETQVETIPLTIFPSWNTDNLWAFAIVQRDSDRHIYNAGSSFILPQTFDVDVGGGQQAIIDGPYTFEETLVTHVGTAPDNTLDISLDTSFLPTGWDGYFTLDGQDLTSTTMTLSQYETASLAVNIVPGPDGGSGRVELNIHSQGGTLEDVNLPFVGLVADSDLLIVTDDGGAGFADDYFGPAINAANKSYAVWDRSLALASETTLAYFDAVIWQTGNNNSKLDADDRAAIQAYTAAGGGIFLSGENLIANTAAEASAWVQFYLRLSYMSAEMATSDVTGVVEDPISDGLVLNLIGGDGADNYADPDVVEPVNGGGGVQCFSYDADSGAGVWAAYNDAKVVTFGFGFESINDSAVRDELMMNIIDWLVPISAVGDQLPSVTALNQNVPNPFNPQTVISFDLAHKAPVQLAVYDVTGRMVRVLANEVRDEGNHSVIWDGRDHTGGQVASGTYIYRLISGDKIESRKMTMVR